ncbi:MAG: hypothetical protein ACKN9S_16785 [Pirellula sp.]
MGWLFRKEAPEELLWVKNKCVHRIGFLRTRWLFELPMPMVDRSGSLQSANEWAESLYYNASSTSTSTVSLSTSWLLADDL